MTAIALRIPGSTANLGPGFDTLALALSVYAELTFELNAEGSGINLVGDLAGKLPASEENLVWQVFKRLWKDKPDLLSRLSITIESGIPLARGLGSSAAAVVGSVWAAHYLSSSANNSETNKSLSYGPGPTLSAGSRELKSLLPSREKMLEDAFQFEGHADNLAASLYGGLVIFSRTTCPEGMITRKLDWPSNWKPVVVVPDRELPTKQAREILPQTVPMASAVSNVQRTALLLHAVQTRDTEALKVALWDELHEPFREALVPELKSLKKYLHDSPALGVTLSGAGSSVLVLVEEDYQEDILELIDAWAQKQESQPDVLSLSVDQHGIQQLQLAAGEGNG